ncbi:hypothetical protein HETIRDRAFT_327212 [Heterobasidion irregulare TC 32-1]|uniref:Uncharacterized protein n=1 Tax=Heterobasidion irregulare (strain TC 32-1) TaxID=747525 RepID=W4JVI0_HETIT|nr:uncharacterized protein HETIRDRAFT_327212 [Heterobasidion irregulare TC 32-1]ETW77085.1 hypothetical protein HETIRDRAFT_327212 [Heterobasidion irregulare TC 32-1]
MQTSSTPTTHVERRAARRHCLLRRRCRSRFRQRRAPHVSAYMPRLAHPKARMCTRPCPSCRRSPNRTGRCVSIPHIRCISLSFNRTRSVLWRTREGRTERVHPGVRKWAIVRVG